MPSPAASPPSSMPRPAASSRRREASAPDRQGVCRAARHHRRAHRGSDRRLAGRARRSIRGLKHTPAGAFGSARFKLKGLDQNRAEYERLIEVFRAHDIGYFFYNGGNDSMDTALKVSQIGESLGYPITCVGVPEDRRQRPAAHRLLPGLRLGGQVHRGLHARSRARRRLDGAHLDQGVRARGDGPARGLDRRGRRPRRQQGRTSRRTSSCFPKSPFEQEKFLAKVKQCVTDYGYCVIVVSEGAAYAGRQVPGRCRHQGRVRSHAARRRGSAGRQHGARGARLQISLGGRGLSAARRAAHRLEGGRGAGLRRRQGGRGARRQGRERRDADDRAQVIQALQWTIGHVPLGEVANQEKKLPRDYITRGRLRHHRGLPPLPRAADRRRGLPALQGRPAGLRAHQGRRRCKRKLKTDFKV